MNHGITRFRVSLEFWRCLKALREKLQNDPDLRDQFDKDPNTLQEGEVSLSTYFEHMGNIELQATIATFFSLSGPSSDRPASVTPLVVANIVANANAVANANTHVNANANTNTNANANASTQGATPNQINPRLMTCVTLPENFEQSEFAVCMSKLYLNRARQVALLKRAVLDPDSTGHPQMIRDQEWKIAKYSYRGITFQVMALMRGADLVIRSVDIIREEPSVQCS